MTQFEPPLVGNDAIGDYWSRVTKAQRDIRLRYGRPVAESNRVAVEWRATVNENAPYTLAGELLLHFLDLTWACGHAHATPKRAASISGKGAAGEAMRLTLIVAALMLWVASPTAQTTCNRACLTGFIDTYFKALAANDASMVPVAATAIWDRRYPVVDTERGIVLSIVRFGLG